MVNVSRRFLKNLMVFKSNITRPYLYFYGGTITYGWRPKKDYYYNEKDY